MVPNISSCVSKNIFREFRIKVGCTSAVIFLWDIIKKNQKIINYRIEEWHTSTPYDIFRNHSTYTNVCLLLDTYHRSDHCNTVCGKWIFDSNLKVVLPLTQDYLNYTCCGNDTDEIKFFGVLYAIREVPPGFVHIRFNMKSYLLIIIIIGIITIYIVVISSSTYSLWLRFSLASILSNMIWWSCSDNKWGSYQHIHQVLKDVLIWTNYAW